VTNLRSGGHTPATTTDVLIVGGGLIGLCCAIALGERGVEVIILTRRLPGEASPAAAGILAASLERATGPAHDFAVAGRDRYPSFIESLATTTGIEVALNRRGLLDLTGEVACERIDAAELRALEPALAAHSNAAFCEGDGAVDNVTLLTAVTTRLSQLSSVRIADALAEELSLDGALVRVVTAGGARLDAARVILAAGAWLSWLRGVPGPVPVEPVRGQMLALGARVIGRVVIGADAYLVPRGGETLVGSTMERVGLEPGTTPEALEALNRAAMDLCPALASAPVARSWSGLRPVTPDLLPILGPHPADPRLLMAAGHSRSGILLAPLTGDCLAAQACGEEPPHDLSPFVLERFH
jgi:glycine oxidase